MDGLPAELVSEILESLEQYDLRRAAAVSRAFYALAWRAGLVIDRRILWEQGKNCSARLTRLSDIVQHARSKSLRLSLTFTFCSDNNASTSEPLYLDVLSLIPTALPILAALSVTITGWMVPSLAAALEHPAPNLHNLCLTVEPPDTRMGSPVMRVDVFNGIAPKLRQLTLRDVRVEQEPVAAFAHVRSLTLQYTSIFPDMTFARHFPVLRSLSLALFKASPASPPFRFGLNGVRLEKLAITESHPPMLLPAILRSNDLVNVPVFEYICASPPWTEPRWDRTNDDGRLSVRLMDYTASHVDVSILVVPENRRWFRAYDVYEWYPDWPSPIADLPRLSERLAYLRMENIYLVGFLECTNLTFQALRVLQIDFWAEKAHSNMVWPPDWIDAFEECTFSFDKEHGSAPTFDKESYRYVECAVLETLRLFAVGRDIRVASEEVAFLGRALRCKEGRAALELHGIELHEPAAQALLDEAFSSVRQYEFAGWDCPVGRDSGLWDIRTSDS